MSRACAGQVVERPAFLHIDGSRPHLKIRRAIVKRRIEPPKTRDGRRDVTVSPTLASKLRAHLAKLPTDADQIVFASQVGTPLDPDTMRRDFLKSHKRGPCQGQHWGQRAPPNRAARHGSPSRLDQGFPHADARHRLPEEVFKTGRRL